MAKSQKPEAQKRQRSRSEASAKQIKVSAKPKQIKEPETSSLGEPIAKNGCYAPHRDGVRPDPKAQKRQRSRSGASAKRSKASAKPKQIKEPETSSLGVLTLKTLKTYSDS